VETELHLKRGFCGLARRLTEPLLSGQTTHGNDSLAGTLTEPLGDHRIRWRLAIRALAISSTHPSARDDEIGVLKR